MPLRLLFAVMAFAPACQRDHASEPPSRDEEPVPPEPEPDLSRLPGPAPRPGTPERPCPDGTVVGTSLEQGQQFIACLTPDRTFEGPFSQVSVDREPPDYSQGEWRGGKKVGVFVLAFYDLDGVQHGSAEEMRDGKVLREHRYVDGKRVDTKQFDASGGLVLQISWHENGAKASETAMRGDNLYGPATTWWENGKKASEGTFENGDRVGPWRFWNRQGAQIDEAAFNAQLLEQRDRPPE